MSHLPEWRLHAPSGEQYYPFRQNEQIGYQFKDGRKLTQREFDQLTNYHDLKAAPRSIPKASGAEDPRRTHLSRTNSGQADTAQLSQDTDRRVLPEPVVGSPPSRNYFVAPGSTSTQPEPHRRGSANPTTRRDTTPSIGDRNRNPHSDRPSISADSVPIDGRVSAGTELPPRLSRLSKDFVGIPVGSYGALYSFVVANPDIVCHTEVDGLITEARAQEIAGNRAYPQTFIHHALLLRECKDLDPQDYRSFFNRLDDRGSDARKKLINRVKVVHAAIQVQAQTPVQQHHALDSQTQGREPNSQIDRHDANRPLSNQIMSNNVQPGAKSRREVVAKDRDGRRVYQDENGCFLRLARSRNDSDRYRGNTDTTEISSKMAEVKIRATVQDVRVQNPMPANTEDDFRNPEGTDRSPKAQPLNRRTSMTSAGQMPTIFQGKADTGREFKATDEDIGKLDSRYSKREDAKKFFSRGRVFLILWHEPAGHSYTDMSKPIGVTRGRFGQDIFSHILRMVVVRELHGACLCLPVNTYGGRGVSKPGFSKADRQAHAIIHMSDTGPRRLPEETDMNKKPIAVTKSSPDQKLDEMSRINFSRMHTVNWNVKVMDVGKVTRESMPSLVTYWKQTFD